MMFRKPNVRTFNCLFNTFTRKNFKNKVTLTEKNVEVKKEANYLKISVMSSEENNLRNKSFYFDNKTNIDSILSQIQNEYDLAIVLDSELKSKLESKLKNSKIFLTEENRHSDLVWELLDVCKTLNLSKEESSKFINEIFTNNSDRERHLKVLHFDIKQELLKMEKTKKRIDEVANRRVTLLLLLLLILLIAQTGWFYHMIFNVDHLGWDLVEPATFLFGSTLFVLGIFSYVKLHKNAISGERLLQDFRKSFLLRRYVRDNFNIEKYVTLNKRLDLVGKQIQNYNH